MNNLQANYGCSVYSQPSFDLNSPPHPPTDPVLGKRTSFLFTPDTPSLYRGKQAYISSTPNSSSLKKKLGKCGSGDRSCY